MTEPPVWRRLSAQEWAAMFPAKPSTLRKMAYALRKLGAGDEPFTVDQFELAKVAGVAPRTIRRYLPVFERYGTVEVKRWRYRRRMMLSGPAPNTYKVFLPAVIPPDWTFDGGDFDVSPRQTMREKKAN